MVSVTVVMSMVPTYSPREPVTTAFPPSARMASNASCSVDCGLTKSPIGLPTEVSEDAELRAKIDAQGIEPRSVGLRDFDAHIRNEMDRLAPLLKSIGDQIGN